jgi:hypothetical protein
MMNVLGNLAKTYDTLSSGQKSFIAETVGGVYQINVLKSILSDLGGGYSIVDAAAKAAGESTAAAETRMKMLNDTISSKLQVTLNNLNHSFESIGSLTIEPTIRGGLGAFDKVINGISSFSGKDSEGIGATLGKGILKGIGNVIAGPGMQFVIFGLIKLFMKLKSFITDSIKDLTGANQASQERAAIENEITTYLTKNKKLIEEIRDGTKSLAMVEDELLSKIKQRYKYARDISILSGAGTVGMQSKGVKATVVSSPAAHGFIPTLDASGLIEKNLAARGGYSSGNVLSTSVVDGTSKIPITANGAETKSSVQVGNMRYEWINPPQNSPAGRNHRQRSILSTGVDPYKMGQRSLAAGGFIPNLSTDGGDWVNLSEILGNKQVVDYLNRVNPGDGDKFVQAVNSRPRKDKYTKGALEATVRGILRWQGYGTSYVENGKDVNSNAIKTVASILGKEERVERQDNSMIRGDDIQKMLNLHGPEFAGLFGYKDTQRKIPFTKAEMMAGETEINERRFSVPFMGTGLKDPNALMDTFLAGERAKLDSMRGFFKSPKSGVIGMVNAPNIFGSNFDAVVRDHLKSMGVPVSEGVNDNLDVLGYKPGAFDDFFPTSSFVAGDVKSSASKEMKDSIAKKLGRLFAFTGGTGQADVPLLNNVGRFKGKGKVGLIDEAFIGDKMLLDQVIYAALATGKPRKIQVGAVGSGKMAAALGGGAIPVTSADVLDQFSEFIINTDAKKGYKFDSGILGIGMATGDVTGFGASKSDIIQRLTGRLSNPNGIVFGKNTLENQLSQAQSVSEVTDYNGVFTALEHKFKGTGRFKMAADGLIPSIRDALGRENKATGGNGTLASHAMLVTASNPLGLAAIDKRSQSSAYEAISQHLALGESMSNVKSAHSASGFVPNLAVDPASQMMMTSFLAMMQGMMGTGTIFDSMGGFKAAIGTITTLFSESAREQKNWLDANRTEILAKKKWAMGVEEARQKLLTGSKSVSLNSEATGGKNVSFRNVEDLESFFSLRLAKAGQSIRKFDDAVEERRKNISRVGYTMSIGGGIAGGVASQAFGSFSPDMASAVDDLTGGIQMAGQSMAAFPNKMGKAIAGFSVINSAISSINSFSVGLQSSKRNLENQSSYAQKLSANIDKASVALGGLQEMIGDSTVSLETMNREQKNYRDALTEIYMTQGGAGIVAKIEGAVTPKEKFQELSKAKSSVGRDLELQATLYQFKELGVEKSSDITNLMSMISGGRLGKTAISGGMFSGFTEADRARTFGVAKNAALNVLPTLSDSARQVLASRVNDPDKFQAVLGNNDNAAKIIAAIKEEGGTSADVKLFVDIMRQMVRTDAISKDSVTVSARKKSIERNASAQLDVDSSVRNEAAYRRLYQNSGAMRSDNVLDQRKIQNKNLFDAKSLILESAKNGSNAFAAVNGEKTVASRDAQLEISRIMMERDAKMSDLKSNTSRSLKDHFANLNIDELTKNSNNAGNALDTNSFTQIAPHNEKIIEGYNKGLEKVMKGGGLTRFVGNGQFDFKSFEKELIAGSGGDATVKAKLENILAANRGSFDALKIVEGYNNENVQLQQEALKELISQTQKLDDIKKEIDQNRKINFMGGTGSLNDREERMKNERDLVRGGMMMDKGPTLEVQAQGASLTLRTLKKLGADLTIGGRDARGNAVGVQGNEQSMRVARAMNIESAGLRQVQSEMFGRVRLGLGAAGAGNASRMVGNFANDPNFRDAAQTAVAAEHRVEGDTIMKTSAIMAATSMDGVSSSLNKGIMSITGFSSALDDLKKKLDEATGQTTSARTGFEAAKNQSTMENLNAYKEAARKYGKEITPESSKNGLLRQGISSITSPGSSILLAAAAFYFRNKLANRKVGGGSKNALDAVIDIATKNRSIGASKTNNSGKPEGYKTMDASERGKYGNYKKASKKLYDQDAIDFVDNNTRKISKEEYSEMGKKGAAARKRNAAAREMESDVDFSNTKGSVPSSSIPQMMSVGKGGATATLYQKVFEALQGKNNSVAKAKDPLIAKFKPLFDAGKITSGADIAAIMQAGGINTKAGSKGGKGGFFNPSMMASGLASIGSSVVGGTVGSELGGYLGGGFGSAVGGIAGSVAAPMALAKAMPWLGRGAAMASPFALPAAAALAGTALVTGPSIYKARKANAGIGEGSQTALDKQANLIDKQLAAGKSVEQILKGLDAQISTTKQQVGGNTVNGIVDFISGAAKQNEALTQQIAVLEAIKQQLLEKSANKDQNDQMQSFLKAISESGGKGGSVSIEISVKDADKLPDIFNSKIIKPLEEQIKQLQGKLYNIEQHVGVDPRPSSVS